MPTKRLSFLRTTMSSRPRTSSFDDRDGMTEPFVHIPQQQISLITTTYSDTESASTSLQEPSPLNTDCSSIASDKPRDHGHRIVPERPWYSAVEQPRTPCPGFIQRRPALSTASMTLGGDHSRVHVSGDEVEYCSLDNALQDDDLSLNNYEDDKALVQSQPSSTDSLDRESIELAASQEVGSETLMELLKSEKDLEQRMNAIEQQESHGGKSFEIRDTGFKQQTASDCGEGKQFDAPTSMRVLFMGCASEQDKQLFVKAISQGLAKIFCLQEQTCSQSGSSSGSGSSSSGATRPSSLFRITGAFKERKHHLFLTSLSPCDEAEGNVVDTCEDYGISIIEADFTRTSATAPKGDLDQMILKYACLQCETKQQEDITGWLGIPPSDTFEGFVYKEKTPNGIDLCVYFYDGNALRATKQEEEEEQRQTKEDMVILWKLKKLGIPVMPLLSLYVSTPSADATPASCSSSSLSYSRRRPLSSSRSPYHHQQKPQMRRTTRLIQPAHTIPERRTQLAELLSQYKIRCIDFSSSSLDVGQAPSFQRRNTRQTHLPDPSLVERLGPEWAASSMTVPAPYQILTIDQFFDMDRRAIFTVLKRSREQALRQEKLLDIIRAQEEPKHVGESDTIPRPLPSSLPSNNTVARICFYHWQLLAIILVLASLLALLVGLRSPPVPKEEKNPWSASLNLAATPATTGLSFVLEVRDPEGNLKTVPASPLMVVTIGEEQTTVAQVKVDDKQEGRYTFTTTFPSCRPLTAPQNEAIKVDVQLQHPSIHLVHGSPIYVLPPLCPSSSAKPSPTVSVDRHESDSVSLPMSSPSTNGKQINDRDQCHSKQQYTKWYHTAAFFWNNRRAILNYMIDTEE